jgi:hypothetical protein
VVKAEESLGAAGAARWALTRARQIFGHGHPNAAQPRRDSDTGPWQVTVHRTALVAVARRPYNTNASGVSALCGHTSRVFA